MIPWDVINYGAVYPSFLPCLLYWSFFSSPVKTPFPIFPISPLTSPAFLINPLSSARASQKCLGVEPSPSAWETYRWPALPPWVITYCQLLLIMEWSLEITYSIQSWWDFGGFDFVFSCSGNHSYYEILIATLPLCSEDMISGHLSSFSIFYILSAPLTILLPDPWQWWC